MPEESAPLWRDPLFSPGDRFPLGPPRGMMANCLEGPSGPATRPYSLRHVVAGARLDEAPPLRWTYCHEWQVAMVYTRRIEPAELDDLTGVDTTAHLFQRFLPKAFEARVTVVGDRVFTAAIHTDSDTGRVDWRADYDSLRYSVVDPPDSVITGMLAFMKQFGLTFGAFDFAVTPEGEWIMFECNPVGAYGWIEDALGLPITDAIADLLANGIGSC